MAANETLAEETASQRTYLSRAQLHLWQLIVSLRQTDTVLENSRRIHDETVELIRRLERSTH